MTVKDLFSVTYDKVIIYKCLERDMYKNLFKGDRNKCPLELLDLNVRAFGAYRKGFLDIWVK